MTARLATTTTFERFLLAAIAVMSVDVVIDARGFVALGAVVMVAIALVQRAVPTTTTAARTELLEG